MLRKARGVWQAFSPASISIVRVRRLNSLFSRSMTLVVRSEIHSSSGKSKKVRQAPREFSRHLTADGISFCQRSFNLAKNSRAFCREEASKGLRPFFIGIRRDGVALTCLSLANRCLSGILAIATRYAGKHRISVSFFRGYPN